MIDTPDLTLECDLTFECDLDEAPEKVWRALAEPELRAAWMGDAEAAACEALEVEPEARRLTLRWSLDEPASLVTFQIDEAATGGTRLVITHSPPRTVEVIPFSRPAGQTIMCAGGWRLAA